MRKKEKPTAALVLSNTEVPNVLSLLDKQIANLKKVEDSVYKTTGTLEGFGDIKQETKLENLIRAHSSVMNKEKFYNESAKDLGLNTYPQFTISGGTSADWKQDILLRIDIITHKEKLDKLKSYKDKMSKFLSEEDQKAMLMQEMATFLQNGVE